jgi:hypothetical protein
MKTEAAQQWDRRQFLWSATLAGTGSVLGLGARARGRRAAAGDAEADPAAALDSLQRRSTSRRSCCEAKVSKRSAPAGAARAG